MAAPDEPAVEELDEDGILSVVRPRRWVVKGERKRVKRSGAT